ncbi:MAG: DUF3043 domain-containing protein [Pseudolysinimonas sp.]|uniref:DUF3043 domain-containing protein n=1 Tax=Pseudolysinimonas sp. TaxID=2680009 RepID=UPI003264F63E
MARISKSEPTPEVEPDSASGKGHATPSRKEQEAARRRPLVPSDRRLAARQNRATAATERDRARVGMAAGDDKYLPLRDKGPQKRYIRDYVDARFSAGELMMPLLVVVLIGSFVPVVGEYAFFAFYAFFIFIAADTIYLIVQVNKRLAAKFGKAKVERGVRWYAISRAIQMRFLRLPKPQVKRGAFPS